MRKLTQFSDGEFYVCEHCGKPGLPSQWTLKRTDGEFLGLTTECANILRNKFGGDTRSLVIVERMANESNR